MTPPPRIRLAVTPTPIEPLPRLSARLGVELWVKRDDLTGSVLTGNKVRKLEYLLAEAQALSADVVLTCGGAQSNHARATALACARLGLRSRLLLRTPDPSHPPATQANLLLDRLAGAEIIFITPAEYRDRAARLAAEAAALRATGARPYVIPEGGSGPLGAWGYIQAAAEIAGQRDALGPGPFTVVYAVGSGGTGAGLLLGRELHGLDDVRIVGVNVCDDAPTFQRVIARTCDEFAARWPIPRLPGQAEIIDGYVGRGYALSRPEELRTLVDVSRTEGLVLDPVYTGKAFHALVSELAREPTRFGPRILFLHTGGVFGLFADPTPILPLVDLSPAG